MARTTGRKRFWFHQKKEVAQLQTTKQAAKSNEH